MKQNNYKLAKGVSISALIFILGVSVGHYQLSLTQLFDSIKTHFLIEEKVVSQSNLNRWKAEARRELFEEFGGKASVVFFGDSNTQLGEWSEFFPNYSVANRGIGGDTTSDLLSRVSEVLVLNPKIVFVMVGINDLKYQTSTEKILENYQKIIEILKRNKVRVVVQPTIQCRRVKGSCGKKVESINELNLSLEMLAKQLNVDFLHLPNLTKSDGLSKEFTTDGVHLSAKGFRVWVDYINEYLAQKIL